MPTVENLLTMIQRPKATKRHEACERLRVSKVSSPEIILALQKATEDKNKDVAKRACYALQAKIHQETQIKMGLNIPGWNQSTANTKTLEFIGRNYVSLVSLVTGLSSAVFIIGYLCFRISANDAFIFGSKPNLLQSFDL